MCVIIDLASYRYNKLKSQGKLNTLLSDQDKETLSQYTITAIEAKNNGYLPLAEVAKRNKEAEKKVKQFKAEHNIRVKNELKKGVR